MLSGSNHQTLTIIAPKSGGGRWTGLILAGWAGFVPTSVGFYLSLGLSGHFSLGSSALCLVFFLDHQTNLKHLDGDGRSRRQELRLGTGT